MSVSFPAEIHTKSTDYSKMNRRWRSRINNNKCRMMVRHAIQSILSFAQCFVSPQNLQMTLLRFCCDVLTSVLVVLTRWYSWLIRPVYKLDQSITTQFAIQICVLHCLMPLVYFLLILADFLLHFVREEHSHLLEELQPQYRSPLQQRALCASTFNAH